MYNAQSRVGTHLECFYTGRPQEIRMTYKEGMKHQKLRVQVALEVAVTDESSETVRGRFAR